MSLNKDTEYIIKLGINKDIINGKETTNKDSKEKEKDKEINDKKAEKK